MVVGQNKCGNFAETQGIWFDQVVNLEGKRYFNFLSWISLPSEFCVCYSHKSHELAQGKCAVGQDKRRESKIVI